MPKVKALTTQAGTYGHKITGDEWLVTPKEAEQLTAAGLVEVTNKTQHAVDPTETGTSINIRDNTGDKKTSVKINKK